MTSTRRLIINSDDFGYTPAVTRGILEAHDAGVLTSTSMLANMPGFDDAVRGARAAGRTLGVGLHLNFVKGRPLSRAPTLIDPDTGEFYEMPLQGLRILWGVATVEDLSLECVSQIVALRKAGIRITHIDSHMHLHALPHVWPVVVGAARGAKIPAVRWPVESLLVRPWRVAALTKKACVGASWRIAQLEAAPGRHPDHFLGMTLQGGRNTQPRLLSLLDRLRPGTTELMVHVGHVDDALQAMDDYTWQRERELAALTSSAVRARLERGDIQLVHFGALA
jgi:predicted glycoside hydrolase/deacetylase ChbG (UPF0249 family)